MNNKTILMITFGMIFLAGVVAANSVSELSTSMQVSPSHIAGGNSFLANFSFNYLTPPNNQTNSPLIIRLGMISDIPNEPVWKGDFKINGYADKCTYNILGFCILPKQVKFSCIESNQTNQTLIINNVYGNNTESNVPNGVFYCFNDSNNLNLNEHDNVFLNITPNIALWPGSYTINASLFYLNDTLPPFVNITNKADFDRYYKPGEYLEVRANISDNVGLGSQPYGEIYDGSLEYGVNFLKKQGGLYYFTETSIPTNLSEGNYPLTITAVDTSGNVGNDTVILKLDETGPVIKVLQPTNGTIVSDMLPIKFNVTDDKSGVNKSSVQFELAEVVNGVPCPDTGIGLNATCPNTHWVSINESNVTGIYSTEVNTTALNLSSGSYWLYATASDNLGNPTILS